ncbi:MAG: DUF3772 domain-containing protein [Pseudomonadota bacterium]
MTEALAWLRKALRVAIFGAWLLFVTATAPVFAQAGTVILTPDGAPDYGVWEQIVERGQTTLAQELATTEDLNTLRADLAVWREAFLERQSVNQARIATTRDQITTLGPPPGEGEVEAEDIASRRAELELQLDEFTAPVRRAEAAFSEADGVIREIDAELRARQANQILRLDPTPLNPVVWGEASSFLGTVSNVVSGEVARNFNSTLRRRNIYNNLPLIGVLLVVGLLLLLRASNWVERGISMLRDRADGARAEGTSASPGLRVATFVASLVALGVPGLGLFALFTALNLIGLDGQTGAEILWAGFAIAGAYLLSRWLSQQLFPLRSPPMPLLNISIAQAKEGRLHTIILSMLVAFGATLDQVGNTAPVAESMTPAARAVLLFPVTLMSGVMLFRLGKILLLGARLPVTSSTGAGHDDTDLPRPGSSGRVTRLLSRACLAVAVIGPVLAALGYATAGLSLVTATFLTFALFGVVVVLQRLSRDIYAMFFGDEAAQNGLIPVLASFALSLCSLPFLALIWGARTADLREVWTVASTGVQFGGNRISPTDFLTFVIVFVLLYSMTRLFQGTLKTQILPKTKLDTGGRNALVAGTGYVGIFLAAILAITSAGIDLSNLAIVAGALSVGIGFGLQTIVSNFVSGIILLIERPISEGDWIEVGGTMGVVKGISVRSTRVETFDRTDVIVPNADLISGAVTNWTKGNLNGRLIVPIGVAYGTDTKKVEKILQEIAMDATSVIVTPPPGVFFVGFGTDSLDFEIRAILRDVNYMLSTRSEINHEINRRFVEEGIEIPYAQRDVWLRNPETLARAPSAPSGVAQSSPPGGQHLSASDLDGDGPE